MDSGFSLVAPSFLGIGVQKCASTWIHRILEDHPQVYVSSPKEVDFFSYHYHFGFQWYENHFINGGGEICGENSPSYFSDERVPKRVAEYKPEMKIIICLRDPVERILSHHAHEVRLGHVDAQMSFHDALKNNPMYVKQSMYGSYLEAWKQTFPAEQVLVLLQEHIQDKPAEIAMQVYEFLNIEPNFKSLFLTQKANVSQMSSYPAFEACLKKSARQFRRLGLGRMVKGVKGMSGIQKIRQSQMQDIRSLIPSLSEEEQAGLDKLFAQDMMKLQGLIDVDLSCWATYQRCRRAGYDI